MFAKLFDYISGENDQQVTVAMTAPVVVQVEPDSDAETDAASSAGQTGGSSIYTMAFYIPSPFDQKPPLPNDCTVSIEYRPELRIFARWNDPIPYFSLFLINFFILKWSIGWCVVLAGRTADSLTIALTRKNGVVSSILCLKKIDNWFMKTSFIAPVMTRRWNCSFDAMKSGYRLSNRRIDYLIMATRFLINFPSLSLTWRLEFQQIAFDVYVFSVGLHNT